MNIRILDNKNFTFMMALCSLLVLAIPVGIANMYLGYVLGESPCTLCWNERIGMVTFGVLALFMVVYGPKLKYIGAMMACAAYGLWMTARHTSLDGWSWDVGMGFGGAIFGAHTYTWGVVVYWCVVLIMGLLLLCTKKDEVLMAKLVEKDNAPQPLTPFSKVVFILSMIVVASNGVQAFFQNGIPPFSGKGEPERFTMDLSTAPERWTTGVWTRLTKPLSLTGKNTIDDAYIVGATTPKHFTFNLKSEAGAIEGLKTGISLVNTQPLSFAATGFMGKGNAAGITYDAKTQSFAVVSNEAGIYFTNKTLDKVEARAVLDKVNGYDILHTVDATWVGNKVISTAWNKTLWAVERTNKVDDFKDWNTFRESTKNLKTSWYRDRPVVNTVRAKKAYVLSIAANADEGEFYFMTAPNNVTKKTILVTVDANDLLPTAEKVLKPSKGLKLKADRNLNDYYVTGMAKVGDKLFAYSRQYNTMLIVNPRNAEVVDAYAMPELSDAHSMTVVDDKLMMLGRQGDKDVVYTLTLP